MNFDNFLEKICKNCLIVNGSCIKEDIYIGLCSKNDREELFLLWKNLYASIKSIRK